MRRACSCVGTLAIGGLKLVGEINIPKASRRIADSQACQFRGCASRLRRPLAAVGRQPAIHVPIDLVPSTWKHFLISVREVGYRSENQKTNPKPDFFASCGIGSVQPHRSCGSSVATSTSLTGVYAGCGSVAFLHRWAFPEGRTRSEFYYYVDCPRWPRPSRCCTTRTGCLPRRLGIVAGELERVSAPQSGSA
jgi:hypothetical protein